MSNVFPLLPYCPVSCLLIVFIYILYLIICLWNRRRGVSSVREDSPMLFKPVLNPEVAAYGGRSHREFSMFEAITHSLVDEARKHIFQEERNKKKLYCYYTRMG